MTFEANPTRKPETESQYRARADNLVAKSRRELKIPPNEPLDHRQFAGWLISNKPKWMPATWRQNKAASLFLLESDGTSKTAVDAAELIRMTDGTGCASKSKKTSAGKQKKFPLSDYKSIYQWMENHPRRWQADTLRWLCAGLLTGLRPAEWATATYLFNIEHGEWCLLVDNAKNSNGRAHGDRRTILLGGLTDDERETIRQHTERANAWYQAGQYRKFFSGCAQYLSAASRTLWPNRKSHVSLYSLRHQFTADAKASGLTRHEIGALMGHGSDLTAGIHYGRTASGREMVRVRAVTAEVEAVRKMSLLKAQRKVEVPAPKPVLNA